MNVFHPFELLPETWTTTWFDWQPEHDELRELRYSDQVSLIEYACSTAECWTRFLDEHAAELERRDPVIGSRRGPMRFSSLISFQCWHAAYHYRQLTATLGRQPTLPASLDDLGLPAQIF